MIAAIDTSQIWAALIAGAFLMLSGLLGVAFRLGVLSRTVKELLSDITEIKDDIRELRRANPFPHRNR